jgi:hypothetical protein
MGVGTQRGGGMTQPCEEYLTLAECARLMHVGRSTAWRIFGREPGVLRVPSPGSKRPFIRVPRAVYDRVLRRSEVLHR